MHYHQNNVISNSVTHGAIAFCILVTIVFTVLKLTGFIDMSWWAVTAPLWLPAAVIGSTIMLVICIFFAAAIFTAMLAKTKRKKGK